MSAQHRIKSLEEWRSKAFVFGRSDKHLANVITRTLELMMTVVRDGTGDEEEFVSDAVSSLTMTREQAWSRDPNRTAPVRELVHALSESIGTTVESMIDGRKRGGRVAGPSEDAIGQDRMKSLEECRSKAFAFGRDEKAYGRLLTAAFDLLLTVVRDGTGDEEESLSDALRSLTSSGEAVLRRDVNQPSTLHGLVYGLCESTGMMIESVMEERKGGNEWSSSASEAHEEQDRFAMPQLPMFSQDDAPSSSNLQLFSDVPAKDEEAKAFAKMNSMRSDPHADAFSLFQDSSEALHRMATSGPIDYAAIDIKEEPVDDWADWEEPVQQEPVSFLDNAQRNDETRTKQKTSTLEQMLQEKFTKRRGEEAGTSSKGRRRTSTLRYSHDYDQDWEIDSQSASGGLFSCTQCNKRFPSLKSLRGHAHRHNGILCTGCNQHVKAENFRAHVASSCKRVVKMDAVVKMEAKVSPSKRFLSPSKRIRSKKGKFERKSGPSSSLTPSAGANPTAYHCTFCGKKCLNKSHFDYHMRTHTGEKPFECPYCDYSVRSLSTRNNHIRSVHNMQPYECLTCAKQFDRQVGLRQHLANNEGHVPASETFRDGVSENPNFNDLSALSIPTTLAAALNQNEDEDPIVLDNLSPLL